MAVSNHELDPIIFQSAKTEFLNNGFENASLNNICKNAGVTTGALYKRYSGKEDLFAAIVAETIKALEDFSANRISVPAQSLSDEELLKLWNMSGDEASLLKWFSFLEKYRDGFVLLINCSAGTRYEKFQHHWVEQMCKATYCYYEELYRRGLAKENISEMEMHIIMTAFWSTVYEPFIHNYNWEQIEKHCEIVCRLFNWSQVFRFQK